MSFVVRNVFGMVFFLEQRCKDRRLETILIREILNVQYTFFLSKLRGTTNIAADYNGSVFGHAHAEAGQSYHNKPRSLVIKLF